MTCEGCQAQVLLALGGLIESVRELNQKVGTVMSQQDDLNTDFTELSTALGDVATQTSNTVTITTQIQAAIAALKAEQPQLDLSELDQLAASAVTTTSGLDTAVSGLSSLVPPAAPATPAS